MLADPTGKRQVARSGVTVGVLSRSRPGRACRRGLGAEAAGRKGFLTPQEPLKNGGRVLYVGAGGGAVAAGGGVSHRPVLAVRGRRGVGHRPLGGHAVDSAATRAWSTSRTGTALTWSAWAIVSVPPGVIATSWRWTRSRTALRSTARDGSRRPPPAIAIAPGTPARLRGSEM